MVFPKNLRKFIRRYNRYNNKNLKKHKIVKISKFGTFSIRSKKSRIGRNPKTKEEKIIKERNVVLFKPSKEFKEYINKNEKI